MFAPFIVYWWFIFSRLCPSSLLFSFDTQLTTRVDPPLLPYHPNANTHYRPHSTATQPPTLTSATHCSQRQHRHPKCQPPPNTSPGLHDIENKYIVTPIADAIYSMNGWLSTMPTHQMPIRTQRRHPLAPLQLPMPIQHTKQPPVPLKPRPGACISNANQHTKRQYPAPGLPPPQPRNAAWWCQSTPTLLLQGFLVGLEAYSSKPIPLGMGLILA